MQYSLETMTKILYHYYTLRDLGLDKGDEIQYWEEEIKSLTY